MSFASNTRAEMARELCTDKCCARAELAAALLASGGISFRFGSDPSYALSVTTAEAAVVRHYFQMVKRHVEKLLRLIPKFTAKYPQIECFTLPVFPRLVRDGELAGWIRDIRGVRPLRADRPLRTGCAGWTDGALRSGCAGYALRTLRAGRTHGADGSLRSLRAGGSLRSHRADRPLWTGFALTAAGVDPAAADVLLRAAACA